MQTITPDFLMSQLRLALVAVLAYGGGAHWFTPEAAGLYLTLFTTMGPIVIPWAWSIASNLGKVSVVSGSAAATVAQVEKVDPASASTGAASAIQAAKAAAVVLLAVMLAFSFGGSASAQTGNIIKDIATARARTVAAPKTAAAAPSATTSPVSSIDALMTKLDKIASDVVAGVVGDINAADLDAGQLLNPSDPTSFKDPIAHACYPAEVKFLQALPTATPTTGNYVVVQLFQKKRDFVNQLKVGLPDYLKIGCGALLGDETQIFISTMAMVGVTVATGGISGLLPAATLLPALPALAL